MSSVSKQVQKDVEAKLDTIFPAGVSVMSRLRGHVSNNIKAKIDAKQIVVMVFPARIGGVKANVTSSIMADACSMQIRVVENPKMNASGLDAETVNEMIIGALAGFTTSAGTTIREVSSDNVNPDSIAVVEYAIELGFKLTFPRI